MNTYPLRYLVSKLLVSPSVSQKEVQQRFLSLMPYNKLKTAGCYQRGDTFVMEFIEQRFCL